MNIERIIYTSIFTALDSYDARPGPDDGEFSALTVLRTGGSIPPTISPFLNIPLGAVSLWGMEAVGGRPGLPLQRTYTGVAPSSNFGPRVRPVTRTIIIRIIF